MNHDARLANLSDDIQRVSWGHVLWDTPNDGYRLPVAIQPGPDHHLLYFEEAENGGRAFGVPPPLSPAPVASFRQLLVPEGRALG